MPGFRGPVDQITGIRMRFSPHPTLSVGGNGSGGSRTGDFPAKGDLALAQVKSILLQKIFQYRPKLDQSLVFSSLNLMYKTSEKGMLPGKEAYRPYAIDLAYLLAEWQVGEYAIAAGILYDIPANKILEALGDNGKKVNNLIARSKLLDGISFDPKKGKDQQDNCILSMILSEPDLEAHLLSSARTFQMMRSGMFKPLEEEIIATRAFNIVSRFLINIGYEEAGRDLMDTAFFFLNPERYKQTAKFIRSQLGKSRMGALKEAQDIIRRTVIALAKKGIFASFEPRIKSTISTDAKIELLTEREVQDVLGLRLVIDETRLEKYMKVFQHEDHKEARDYICYDAFQLLISTLKDRGWEEDKKGRVDYIAAPKDNKYRSIHTKFMKGPRYIEVQIRTREMDEIAKRGSASHALVYKKLKLHDAPDIDFTDPSAVQRFRALREGMLDEGRIYARTEDGKIVKVSTGKRDSKPTVLDFAFATGRGLKLAAAQIQLEDGNWKDIVISDELPEGATIRIVTTKKEITTKGRKDFANTPLARAALEEHFEDGESNADNLIRNGRDLFKQNISRFTVSRSNVLGGILGRLKERKLKIHVLYSSEAIAQRMGLKTKEDLFMRIARSKGDSSIAQEIESVLREFHVVAGFRDLEIEHGTKANLWLILRDKAGVFAEVTKLFQKNMINMESVRLERLSKDVDEGSLFMHCEISYKSVEQFWSLLNNLQDLYEGITPLSFRFNEKPISVDFKIKKDKIGIAAEISKMVTSVGANIINVDIGPLETGSLKIEIPLGRKEKMIAKLRKAFQDLERRRVISGYDIWR